MSDFTDVVDLLAAALTREAALQAAIQRAVALLPFDTEWDELRRIAAGVGEGEPEVVNPLAVPYADDVLKSTDARADTTIITTTNHEGGKP